MKIVPDRKALLEELPKGGWAVEVGTLRGDFAIDIWEIIKPTELILIDPWTDYQIYNGEVSYQLVKKILPEAHLYRGYSYDGVPTLNDKSLSFAYVDADHQYEGCLNDLELLYPKMKRGGWLCGHDYCAGCDFGVVRAVTVFCYRHNLEISLMTDEPPGDWLGPVGNQPLKISYNSYGIQIP